MTTAISNPAEISAYRLLTLKAMLRLESKGMRTRGGAVRPRIAAAMGLKARDSYETYISAIEKKVEALMSGQPDA